MMILIKIIMILMIMIMRSKNLGTSLGRGKAPVSGKDQHEQSAGVSQGALLLHTDHDDDAMMRVVMVMVVAMMVVMVMVEMVSFQTLI